VPQLVAGLLVSRPSYIEDAIDASLRRR
jgi:hypothetical protein